MRRFTEAFAFGAFVRSEKKEIICISVNRETVFRAREEFVV